MTATETNNTSLRDANVELVQQMIQAINQQDMTAMAEVLHEEAALEMPYTPAPFPRVTSPRHAIIEFVSSVPGWLEPENL